MKKVINSKYILKGKKVIPEPNILKWGKWFEKANRHVGNDYNEDKSIHVSTVFLGLDYNFGFSKKPIVFETMIFGGWQDGYEVRYSTWEEAEAGHKVAVKLGFAKWYYRLWWRIKNFIKL